MKKGTIVIIALIGVLLMGGCWTKNKFNGLVTEDEHVKEAWSNVESQYQRRADLIPNIVSTVKGEANFEQKTLTDVIEARAKATQMVVKADDLTPEKMEQFQANQGQLSQALGRLMMITENYPNLKANEAFRALQVELEGTENRIQVARTRFNETVKGYNLVARSFPTNMLAGMFGFPPREGFHAEVGAEKAPKIDFAEPK